MASDRTMEYAPSTPHVRPIVRRIEISDLRGALARGWEDFSAHPMHVIFLCAIYPAVGLLLGRMAFGGPVLPLLYPMVAGFALLGPLAALGMYELSRRREQGLESTWRDAFQVVRSPNIGGLLLLGMLLMALFVLWLEAAHLIWRATIGGPGPDTLQGLLQAVTDSPGGVALVVAGNLVGFLFAAAVLCLTVMSFPLLLDRAIPGGAAAQASVAVQTSIAAVVRNPLPMAAWGMIVAVLLALGSLPLFVGLAVVLPVLGHATWHLYRRVVRD
jgi:uncharacterized membrane protein